MKNELHENQKNIIYRATYMHCCSLHKHKRLFDKKKCILKALIIIKVKRKNINDFFFTLLKTDNDTAMLNMNAF